ncbi:hypothetical protein RISK_000906 [Rhodopirellula islandica]|uniref:Uncharacterized protein n=1 Tax=Rhodopirellula islandica TaxID=595434 RepID=A0A0J1BKN5_RHOIS|nr:hypothetical protein RISK_000906 [Rhodopirellula islandica]
MFLDSDIKTTVASQTTCDNTTSTPLSVRAAQAFLIVEDYPPSI